MNPTLTFADRRTTLQVRAGLTMTVTQRPTTLAVTHNGQTLELPIRKTTVEVRSPLQLEVPVRRTTLVFTSPGVQGSPGPAQIYDQLTAPTPIVGYTLLWFQGGLADPDDREINLVVSP